jgi:hypothetical protein
MIITAATKGAIDRAGDIGSIEIGPFSVAETTPRSARIAGIEETTAKRLTRGVEQGGDTGCRREMIASEFGYGHPRMARL